MDVTETEEMQQYIRGPSRREEAPKNTSNSGFVIRDAPWSNPPEISNVNEFPSMGGPAPGQAPGQAPAAPKPAPAAASSAPRWGPSYKR